MGRRFNISEVFSDIRKWFWVWKTKLYDIKKLMNCDIRNSNSWYQKITSIFWHPQIKISDITKCPEFHNSDRGRHGHLIMLLNQLFSKVYWSKEEYFLRFIMCSLFTMWPCWSQPLDLNIWPRDYKLNFSTCKRRSGSS